MWICCALSCDVKPLEWFQCEADQGSSLSVTANVGRRTGMKSRSESQHRFTGSFWCNEGGWYHVREELRLVLQSQVCKWALALSTYCEPQFKNAIKCHFASWSPMELLPEWSNCDSDCMFMPLGCLHQHSLDPCLICFNSVSGQLAIMQLGICKRKKKNWWMLLLVQGWEWAFATEAAWMIAERNYWTGLADRNGTQS